MQLRRSGVLFVGWTLLWIALSGPVLAKDPFPIPKGLEDAVEFWLNVFTQYSTKQAVLHDTTHLSLVYDRVGPDQRLRGDGSRDLWRAASQARDRYARLLRGWASAPPRPESLPAKERRIYLEIRRLRYPLSEAARNVRAQQGLREKFREGIIRSGLYIDRMREIFRQYGLPEDLTILPHVESSFDYRAYSRFGAAGIWQFTRSTGRLFLNINYDVDERRDPLLATHAAARLLRKNYQDLGSWPLAITAYNHGPAGMQRAVRNVGTAHLPTIIRKYDGPVFGFASKNFYAEFLAARIAVKNSRKHFGPLHPMKPIQYKTFALPHYISVETLTRHLPLSLEDIQDYNPALRPPILRGERYVPKDYVLRVPADRFQRIRLLYASLPSPLKFPGQKQARWYQVRRGDSLSEIARRFNTSIPALIAANNLGNPRMIRVGAILGIPGSQKAAPAREPEVKVADQKQALRYQVRRGDTLSEIARRFNTSIPALIAANNLGDPRMIRVGAILAIPGSKKAAPAREPEVKVAAAQPPETKRDGAAEPSRRAGPLEVASARKAPAAPERASEPGPAPASREPAPKVGAPAEPAERKKAPEQEADRPAWRNLAGVHTAGKSATQGWTHVEPEETLGHIAEWLEVSPSVLRRLNGLRRGQSIRLGQKLILSFHRVAPEAFEQKRLEYHKGLEDDFFENYQVTELDRHTIQKGENLWALAQNVYEVPFWLMARYNPSLFQSGVNVGDQVIFPVVIPKSQDSPEN
ncbi:MAG: LysM peptidoglycan-binding domain-containing protein [Candidatus Tectomicrobia bacterium]|nr:LysM peptidoglycan-binding domain-containing protein [Candidatus Tectomicrobia bacterium]